MSNHLRAQEFSLYGLAGLNVIMVGQILILSWSSILLSVAVILSLTMLIVSTTYHLERPGVVGLMLVCVAMFSGMLIGTLLDFGRHGLLLSLNMCQALASGQFWLAILKAPWTHVGMVLGCSMAMVLVQKNALNRLSCFKHGCCLIGMFIGMWLFSFLPLDFIIDSNQWSFALSVMPLTAMWLAMSFATAVVYLAFETIEKCRATHI